MNENLQYGFYDESTNTFYQIDLQALNKEDLE